MTKPLDLTGNKYGRYTVIERTSNSKAGMKILKKRKKYV